MTVERVPSGTQTQIQPLNSFLAPESDKVSKIRATLERKLAENQEALDAGMAAGLKDAKKIIHEKMDHNNSDRQRLDTIRFDSNQNPAGVSPITKRAISQIESELSALDRRISEKADQMAIPAASYKSISATKQN